MKKIVFALFVLPLSLFAGDFERNSGQIRYTGGEPAQEVFYRLRTSTIDWYFTRFGFSAVKKTYAAGGEEVSLKRVDFVVDKKGSLTCAETSGYTKQISLTARDGSVLSFSVFEDVMTMQSSKGANASLSFEVRGAMPEVNTGDLNYFEINAGEGISWYQMPLSGSTNRIAEMPEPVVTQNRISYQHVDLTSLAWVTYCGGFDADELYAEALCPNGDLLVAGRSQSLNFPVDTNAVQVNNAGSYDAIVCRIKPDGTKRWSTYLGGTGFDNAWSAAAIGDDFIVCGSTNSINFPVLNAAQPTIGGSFDAFVTRFDSNGTVIWSTYFGGSAAEQGLAVAVDVMDNIFIGGSGNSANMPMASSGWQTTPGGQLDGFVARLSSSNGAPVWSTFCGGSATEDVHDLTTGPGGLIAACGETFSSNFPSTANAFQTNVTGLNDAYLLVMDTAGNRIYNTCLGGFNGEDANGVRFDANGNVYITGYTLSPDFPVTGAQYQNVHNGGNDVFVARFNANWQLNWATYLGTPNAEQAYCMALSGKYIYIGGYTDSPVFPVSTLADQDSLAGLSDAFYCKFDTAGNWITASYFGGSGVDLIYGIVVNADTMAYLVGNTFSNNLPTLPGVWQPTYVSLGDGFIAFRDLSEELNSNSTTTTDQMWMQNGLIIGPNPAGDELLLKAETEILFATITDMTGKTVLKSSPNSNQFTFDLTLLSSGVYVVEVVQQNGRSEKVKIVRK